MDDRPATRQGYASLYYGVMYHFVGADWRVARFGVSGVIE